MGEPIKQQRRGKGSPTWQANSRHGKGDVEHRNAEVSGTVVDIQHDPSRTAPIAVIEYEDGDRRAVLAPETIEEGQEVEIGPSAEIEAGNTLPVGEIPEGVPIHSIELQPGDGGKMVRSSGTYAFVVTHERDGTRISLPSGSFKKLNKECRATVGKVAGGGRQDKPFVKAGNKHHAMKARGKKYPTVSAVSMNAVDHPFGGSAKPGQPKTVSRHASPGSKVGSVSARQTGNKSE